MKKLNITVIKHYPYRTACVCVDGKENRRELESLERQLAAQAGVSRDNHTVYVFRDEDTGIEHAIQFHDCSTNWGKPSDVVVENY